MVEILYGCSIGTKSPYNIRYIEIIIWYVRTWVVPRWMGKHRGSFRCFPDFFRTVTVHSSDEGSLSIYFFPGFGIWVLGLYQGYVQLQRVHGTGNRHIPHTLPHTPTRPQHAHTPPHNIIYSIDITQYYSIGHVYHTCPIIRILNIGTEIVA